MKFGVTMFSTDYAIPPHELAIEAEARGFESVWFPEHSHIPTSRKSPWPGGAELPKWYYDTYDPFLAMAAAAVVTKTIKLGTGVCLVVQRDPIHTAKEVSTVDRLSNGRLLFGIGGGWNEEEMADHGTAFATRFKLMRERIEAMKEIWARSKPTYRRAGQVRRDDAVAQAGAKAASADHRRRGLPAGRAPRHRLCQRLDADRRPRRRHAGDAAAVPRDAEGGRPRRVRRAGHDVRRRHERRGAQARRDAGVDRSCSASRPRPGTRSCPARQGRRAMRAMA